MQHIPHEVIVVVRLRQVMVCAELQCQFTVFVPYRRAEYKYRQLAEMWALPDFSENFKATLAGKIQV